MKKVHRLRWLVFSLEVLLAVLGLLVPLIKEVIDAQKEEAQASSPAVPERSSES